MAIGAFVLGHSGSGKSFSLKNLDPQSTGLINVVGKMLPFRGAAFKTLVSDDAKRICEVLQNAKTPIVVIDDFQYIMANDFMRTATDEMTGNKSFQRFNIIGQNAWNILNTITHKMQPHQRVYVLSHTDTDNFGNTKIKTIGKLLDEKITPEGMVGIVLQTQVNEQGNFFMTKNSGNNTVKTPYEMFDSELIPNDLKAVDDAICDYYGIPQTQGA